MNVLVLLCFTALISMSSSLEVVREADPCHSAFDLGPSEKLSLDLTVTSEKINSLGKAYISYNHCTNEREAQKNCNKYRLILAPANQAASLFTVYDTISSNAKIKISALMSGDRVILEGLSYSEGEEIIPLKPIVFTIE